MAELWDEIIGKHVLVGMTYLDNNDQLIEQKQKHGVIVSADSEGVYVRAADSDPSVRPRWGESTSRFRRTFWRDQCIP